MKLFGRLRTVFVKLILSYIVLILITLIFVGVTSYLYFASSFNEQIEKVNQRILSHLSQTIEKDVISIVESNYLSIAAGDVNKTSPALFFFDNGLEGHHSKVKDIHMQLKTLVASNSDLIASIAVYYKNNNVLISSDAGITYLDQAVWIDLDWLQRAQSPETRKQWMETRKVSSNIASDSHATDLMTFVRPYPYTSNEAKIKGYIAIHINESALRNIIHLNDPSDSNQMVLLDSEGNTLSHSTTAALYKPLSGYTYIADILNSDSKSNHFVEKLGTVKTMISYVTIPSAGWKLVSMTPVDEFYKSTTPIRNTLILICFIAIVIGLIVSNIFTFNMYNPLKAIIHKARQRLGTNHLQNENEFMFIDHVMNNLSVKVSELETTLIANMPIIKHNLVLGLLTSGIHSEHDLSARLQLLRIQWPGDGFISLKLQLDSYSMRLASHENSQYVIYNLIEHIEQQSGENHLFLAMEQSDFEISVIACCKQYDMNAMIRFVEDIAAYAYSSFMIQMTAAIGTKVDTPLELHVSFAQTQALLKYYFIAPEVGIYYGDSLLQREQCTEEISEEPLKRFAISLRTNNREAIRKEIHSFIELLQKGPFNAEHCRQKWFEYVDLFHVYCKEMNLRTKDIWSTELMESWGRLSHIADHERWLQQAVDETLAYWEKRNGSRTNDIIRMVKEYILSNIAAPLSLDTAADQVSLSPRYLSRVFKDEVGINFTDFVTKQRIEKAKELIISTDLQVEQIAEQVGFNSSAYFIKKFKETYGVTPKNYKHYHNLDARSI